jgi:hypothetical protein
MQWIGLGKVAVGTPGTPVYLSPVPKKVHSIMLTYDSADAGAVFIKDRTGNVIAALGPNTTSPVSLDSGSGQNAMDLNEYWIDAPTGGRGPYVGYSLG